MENVKDGKKLNDFFEKTEFLSFFDTDVRPITELLLFRADEHLIEVGARSRYLLFLVSGSIKYYTTSDNGKLIPFGGSRGFRILGEVSSLWGKEPVAGVQAVEDSFCLAINLDLHREKLFSDNRFLRNTCQLLAEKVELLDNNIAAYIGGPVEERLASFILQNSSHGTLNSSLRDCSEAIATSYRHLLRIIRSFCERGYLKKDGRRYLITDADALASLSADTFAYFD